MKEQMAFEKNVFNKTSRTDSKCPRLPCTELSDAHCHLRLDRAVPVGLTYPQAIPFSSDFLRRVTRFQLCFSPGPDTMMGSWLQTDLWAK